MSDAIGFTRDCRLSSVFHSSFTAHRSPLISTHHYFAFRTRGSTIWFMPNWETDHDEAVVTESREKVKKPPLYKVLIHNDDFTTMEFVVLVLQQVFNHEESAAFRIMWQVHLGGVGIAGVYTLEIAETKAAKAAALAQSYEYPLLFTVEAE